MASSLKGERGFGGLRQMRVVSEVAISRGGEVEECMTVMTAGSLASHDYRLLDEQRVSQMLTRHHTIVRVRNSKCSTNRVPISAICELK